MNRIATHAFYDAVKKNNLDLAASLYKHCAPGMIDINATNALGMSPLHHAAEYGNRKMVKFLIDVGANLDARNMDEETPLNLCCHHETASIIVNVLKRRKELLEAAKMGNVTLAAKALADGGKINFPDPKGKTALHHAVHVRTSKTCTEQQRHNIVRFLLKNGANPNTITEEGTPLQTALGMNDIPMAGMLITAGADIHNANLHGTPTLFCAASIAAFELLVAKGADPYTHDSLRRGMLHRTAEKGSLPLMQHLMAKYGMQELLNTPDALGRTPLYLAAKNKQVETIRFLIAQPGILYVAADDGTTPAMTTNNKEVRALLKDMERAGAAPVLAPACKPPGF